MRLVKIQEKSLRLKIPTAILFTRTSAVIRPRTQTAIEAEFSKVGMRVLETQLHQRDAYKAMFSFGRPLSGLDPSQAPKLPEAKANARAFMVEVVNLLKGANRAGRARSGGGIMANERLSVFDNAGDVDLTGFTPEAGNPEKAEAGQGEGEGGDGSRPIPEPPGARRLFPSP